MVRANKKWLINNKKKIYNSQFKFWLNDKDLDSKYSCRIIQCSKFSKLNKVAPNTYLLIVRNFYSEIIMLNLKFKFKYINNISFCFSSDKFFSNYCYLSNMFKRIFNSLTE